MRINNNIQALNTYNRLTVNNDMLSKSLEKLSSGMRINRAGDDAAGLAISEKMRGQIRGLNQAQRNAQDAISLIQTGEGALNEVHSILQRMRELAVQAANGTATDDDRSAIQAEIEQLKDEIDRIANTTQFNTMNLLDGSQSKVVTFTSNNTKVVSARVISASMENGNYSLTVANAAGSGEVLTATGSASGKTGAFVTLDTSSATANVGEVYTIEWDDGDSATATVTLRDSTGNAVATINNVDMTKATAFSFATNAYKFNFTSAINKDGAGSITFRTEMKADYTITDPGGASIVSQTGVISNSGTVDLGGFRLTVDKTLTAGTDTFSVVGNDIEFQIGANESQTTSLSISDMRTAALGIDDLDVSDQTNAKSAITDIDSAIKLVSEERSKLGALQNRLEHTINNLGTASENLTAAESRIRDVDMAKEMMTYTKNNILMQAATAMLAQANQLPQAVLQLLR